jgi:hypothetical protein
MHDERADGEHPMTEEAIHVLRSRQAECEAASHWALDKQIRERIDDER